MRWDFDTKDMLTVLQEMTKRYLAVRKHDRKPFFTIRQIRIAVESYWRFKYQSVSHPQLLDWKEPSDGCIRLRLGALREAGTIDFGIRRRGELVFAISDHDWNDSAKEKQS